MTLYAHALRQSWLPWLMWALAVALFTLAVVSAASAVEVGPALFTRLMASMPPRLLALFGGRALLSHPLESYLDAKLLSYLPLFGALLAAFQAASLARDLERGRGDFLLSLPVTRAQVLGARALALLTTVAALWAATLATLALCLRAYGFTVDLEPYLVLAYSGFLVDAVLAVGCLWLSALARTYREALRLALGLALVPLVYDYALQMALAPRVWRLLLPYGYYDPPSAFAGHAFPWAATLVLIPAAVLAGALAQLTFTRREA